MRRITDFLKGKTLLLLIAVLVIFTGIMWSLGVIHERYLISRYLETGFSFRPAQEVSYTEFSRIFQSGQVERGLIVMRPLVLIPGLKGFVKTKSGAVVGADLSQTGGASWSDALSASGKKVYNKIIFPGDFIAFQVSPFLLFIMVFIWLSGSGGTRELKGFLVAKGREYLQKRVTFNDVGGFDEVKKELQEAVSILGQSEIYQSFGVRCERGYLFHGPPGCGKTLIAKAVAGEAGVPYLLFSAASIGGIYVGRGAMQVQDFFNQARTAARLSKKKGAIIVLDEVETLIGRRGIEMTITGHGDRTQTTNQFLAEMDGVNTGKDNIVILACTNRLDLIDDAAIRPGRLGRQIHIGPPDKKGREAILEIHTRNKPLSPDVKLEKIAQLTPGFSGAQLADLANIAAKRAVRKYADNLLKQVISKLAPRQVTADDFYGAISEALAGVAQDLDLSLQEEEIIVAHESGHAICARIVVPERPIRRIVVVPHEKALGYVWVPPERDKYLRFIEEIKAEISLALAGKEAEICQFGTFSDGSVNDRKAATQTAKRLVWQLMSLQYFDETDEFKPDDITRASLNNKVEQVLAEAAKLTREILTREEIKPVFQELKDMLLQARELEEEELEKIFSKIPREVAEHFQNQIYQNKNKQELEQKEKP